jgi:hypothetical protein
MNGTSAAELIDEASKWSVGLGTLTLVLAPLSIPFLVLTAVAVLPLLLPVVAVALLAAIVALPLLLIRALGRRLAGGVSSPAPASRRRSHGETRAAEVLR